MRVADSPEVLKLFHGELDLVDILARRVHRTIGRSVEFGDLQSAGREGLLDAARRYERTRGVVFRSFAYTRVYGAIYDGVRRMGVSRRTWERMASRVAASGAIDGDAERILLEPGPLSDGEAEQELRDELSAVATAAAIGLVAQAIRNEAAIESGERSSATPEEAFGRAELLAHIQRAMATLGPSEAEVVKLLYFEGKEMAEAAREVGLERSWTSRLHSRAIAKLRDELSQLK